MDKLLTVNEVAEYLKLAKITIYKMVSAKAIPHVKLNRRLLFDPNQLQLWIEEKSVRSIR